jgi:hypothetical protein
MMTRYARPKIRRARVKDDIRASEDAVAWAGSQRHYPVEPVRNATKERVVAGNGGRSRDHDLFNLDEAAWGTSDAAIVQQWNRGLV